MVLKVYIQIKTMEKKSQAYLLGGFMLFIILFLFIISKNNPNSNIEMQNYVAKNIANEFIDSLNAFFLKNNNIDYTNSGMAKYCVVAQNFSKSESLHLNAYYVIIVPNTGVIFGNYLGENLYNVSFSINNETIVKPVLNENNIIFYFNETKNNSINYEYCFNTSLGDFKKSKTIQNKLHYIYWIKLTNKKNKIIKEIIG